MYNPLLPFLSLLGLITLVSATALTYQLSAHEEACFFTHVEKKDSKIAFYFAVQSGGNFDSTSSLGEKRHICSRRARMLTGSS